MKVYLHTGSNLGDRAANLAGVRERITAQVGPIEKASRIFVTAPWGVRDQPDFYNQALEVHTTLAPAALLEVILHIEKDMGRTRESKWRQRLIDIDILFYEDRTINVPGLCIPHPFLHERNFVLVPLLDIAPDLIHPVLGRTIRELHQDCPDDLPVSVIAE